ncbi:hypothetical protein B296_00003280 [Ensete ventricosum]|uniref:Uncharacterized protein n=1 Tax=Ensete ventricosum TaxID=4639 RepID=A0A427B0M8_ENSVE|nr:hypothetical protein B296_00003280 [Ensete ventricosum]
MQLGTRQECVGSSPRVSGVYQDSAREFAKRRPRLVGRLSGIAEKLIWTQDQAKVSGQGLDDAEGARREFARRFTEGIGKLARNIPGDRRRKTVRFVAVRRLLDYGSEVVSLVVMFDYNL